MFEVFDVELSFVMIDILILLVDMLDIEYIGMKFVVIFLFIKLMWNWNLDWNWIVGKGEFFKFGVCDKVRKRKRFFGDKDVGSVRFCFVYDLDDLDSDILESFKVLVMSLK